MIRNYIQKYMEIRKKSKGFTILETLVAIFILTLSITGPLVFAQSGLRASFLARDQITAFYLAQDAIETIKNKRDQNILDGNFWLDGMIPCDYDYDKRSCNINTTTAAPEFVSCSGNGYECQPLQYTESGVNKGFFTVESGTDSQFTRTVYLYQFRGGDGYKSGQEAQIVVMVTWTSKAMSGTRKIVVQENIFNWYPE